MYQKLFYYLFFNSFGLQQKPRLLHLSDRDNFIVGVLVFSPPKDEQLCVRCKRQFTDLKPADIPSWHGSRH